MSSRIGLTARHHHLPVLVKCCLNGARSRAEHAALPITPDELARDACSVVAAGAMALHVHPRDVDGNETLDATYLANALAAMREAVTVPVGVSTGAWLLPDPSDRLRAIEGWRDLPDFASVNFHEAGAVEIAGLLLDRGVAVEAGLWNHDAAVVFAASDLGDRCLRILLEPMEQTAEAALRTVATIEDRLRDVDVALPRLLHGYGRTAWPMVDEAVRRGNDVRIGFEDTLERPDGTRAESNEELVRLATVRCTPP